MNAKHNVVKVEIKPSTLKTKKYTAIFYDDKNKKIKTTHFGNKGSSDYTINKNDKTKMNYLKRHEKNENWNDPMTAGALSRWILWGDSTSIKTNIKDFKKRFKLK